MELEESGFIVATLLIALIALLLVLVARRDARIIREHAQSEAERMRADLVAKNAELAQRAHAIEQRETTLESRNSLLDDREASTRQQLSELSIQRDGFRQELLTLSGLTEEQARTQFFQKLAFEESTAVERLVSQRVTRAERESKAAAQRILVNSMARLSVATSSDLAIDVFELESEDLKGRIIGKEGRNIRTFEAVSGVNLIIEDNSLSVKISSFDAERRDVAHSALGQLLRGGMVTPARIEAEVTSARQSLAERSREAGFRAVEEVGISDISPELVATLGRLRFRTSFTQNVLDHSIETALIAGLIADEIGLDAQLARRAGLLHDIGKALTPAQRGSHASLGAKLAREHGENPSVVNIIASHHGDIEAESLEAVVVQIADGISAARPGARNEDIASYVERMQNIESVLLEHSGVQSAFVLASGRQVRVAVSAEVVPDHELGSLSTELADLLQDSMVIPGEIELTVVRENRIRTVIG